MLLECRFIKSNSFVIIIIIDVFLLRSPKILNVKKKKRKTETISVLHTEEKESLPCLHSIFNFNAHGKYF